MFPAQRSATIRHTMASIPARLGPYEIVSRVGAGGMGEVYKATDTRLGRTVAIKVLPAHVAGDPAFRARFEREAKAISSLNHPHICTLHDIGHQEGTDFLVMEYLEGETLSNRLARGRCRLRRRCRLASRSPTRSTRRIAATLSGRGALRRCARRSLPRERVGCSHTGGGQRGRHVVVHRRAEFSVRAFRSR